MNIGGFGFFENSNVTIYNSYFSNNAVELGNGGCFYLNGSKLEVEAGEFSGNTAYSYGGVISANYTTLNITNVIIYGNLITYSNLKNLI